MQTRKHIIAMFGMNERIFSAQAQLRMSSELGVKWVLKKKTDALIRYSRLNNSFLLKKTGQYYAAKVFTENRRCVVNETLKKELAILEMVNHENVVKLIKDDVIFLVPLV